MLALGQMQVLTPSYPGETLLAFEHTDDHRDAKQKKKKISQKWHKRCFGFTQMLHNSRLISRDTICPIFGGEMSKFDLFFFTLWSGMGSISMSIILYYHILCPCLFVLIGCWLVHRAHLR